MKYVVLIFLLFVFIGCKKEVSFNEESMKKMNASLVEYKTKFAPSLVGHFPNKLKRLGNSLNFKTDIRKGDIGLYLYQYNVSNKEIYSIVNYLSERGYKG
ncbi:hypothetical protein ACYSNM_13240 [Myroides sp. LJL116]